MGQGSTGKTSGDEEEVTADQQSLQSVDSVNGKRKRPRSTVAPTALVAAMMAAAIQMDIWIGIDAHDSESEQWRDAGQGTAYTPTAAEDWRNKNRKATSYEGLTQAATAAKRARQTVLNLTVQLDQTG